MDPERTPSRTRRGTAGDSVFVGLVVLGAASFHLLRLLLGGRRPESSEATTCFLGVLVVALVVGVVVLLRGVWKWRQSRTWS